MSTKINSISIFLLAYNDEKTIGKLIYKTYFLLKRLKIDFEIIVGNDASKDKTLKILKEIQHDIPMLQIINSRKNRGYAGNLATGLAAAKKEFVFYTDGDGQYDVGDLELLLKKLNKGVDVVNGFRVKKNYNYGRRILGDVYERWLRKIFGLQLRDINSSFRLIRRSFLEKITLDSRSGAICAEMIIKLQQVGARFAEVEVNHFARDYGKSEFFTIKKIINTFFDQYFLLKIFKEDYFRFAKFVLVGLSSFAIQFSIFNYLLIITQMPATLATLLSDEFAIVSSFFLNNKLTFRDRPAHRNNKLFIAFVKYHAVVLVATLIQTGTVFFGSLYLGNDLLTSNLLFMLGLLISMFWNYKLYSYFVWPQHLVVQKSKA
ncbi:bifunctional glycosyltransferase family 2/GtrA family protein [Patescibacteria group bacterium]|nr:bifunctional glycosyltransferase family 2/GtrA family protein [Patescibacteria group bacterium]